MASDLECEALASSHIRAVYTPADICDCPPLRRLMLARHTDILADGLAPKLEACARDWFLDARRRELNVIETASMGTFVGAVSGLALNAVEPVLDTEVVHERPTESLACLEAHCRQQPQTIQHQRSRTTPLAQTASPGNGGRPA